MANPKTFAAQYAPIAKAAGDRLGVDPHILLGQWGLETGWGKSVIPGTNNLGNIKDFTGGGVGAIDNMTGSNDKYRAFDSPEEFADHYAGLIERKYPAAIGAGDNALAFAKALKDGGYAEDPAYIRKMVNVTNTVRNTPGILDTLAAAIFPAAQAGTLPEKLPPLDMTKVKFLDGNSGGAGAGMAPLDMSKVKFLDGDPASVSPEPLADNSIVAMGAGLGAGLGQVVLGAQDYLGQGLQAVGAERLGNWLVDDATQGKEKLQRELQPFKEQSPISSTVGQIGGNVVGLNPVLRVAGGLVSGAGAMGAAPSVLQPVGSAIASSGLRSAGVTGAKGLAAKTAGGAIAGGVGAGLVDPESAGTGALIGAALPGAFTGLAKAGDYIGSVIRGPGVSDAARQAASAATEAGYVIPPTQVNPTLFNRILEGTAGKLSTGQKASAKNQSTTNTLARKALGLPEDTALTPDVLLSVRREAGKAYEALRSVGVVPADDVFNDALSKIEATYRGATRSFPGMPDNGVGRMVESLRVPSFDAGDAVDAIALLRDNADTAFRSGNAALGRASKQAAEAVEDAVERAIKSNGDEALMRRFKNARTMIAKTYSVQKAANPATGTVDAKKLAAQLAKGRPLSGELKQIADFAAAFPKAAQAVEGMGSLPGFSPLDVAAGGVTSAATSNPAAMLSIFLRPAARGAALSQPVQRRLSAAVADSRANPVSSALLAELLEQAYRGAPLLSTSQ